MTRTLAELSWTAIAALPKDPGVVLLPIGATEQHGPHLPCATDTLLVTRLLEAALALLPDAVAAWVLPALPYGKSTEHARFPGTLTLSAATLLAVVHDIAQGVAAAGFRRLALVNGHGGNSALLEVAARDLTAATGLRCFCLQPVLLVEPPYELPAPERRLGFHAGELETSLLLSLAPHLVDMAQASPHYAKLPETGTALHFFGPAAAAWLTHDWSTTGVFGDPTPATAAKGAAIAQAAAERLAALIAAISVFPVD